MPFLTPRTPCRARTNMPVSFRSSPARKRARPN